MQLHPEASAHRHSDHRPTGPHAHGTNRGQVKLYGPEAYGQPATVYFATVDPSIDMDMLALHMEGDISDSRGIPPPEESPSPVLFFAKAMPSNSRA